MSAIIEVKYFNSFFLKKTLLEIKDYKFWGTFAINDIKINVFLAVCNKKLMGARCIFLEMKSVK